MTPQPTLTETPAGSPTHPDAEPAPARPVTAGALRRQGLAALRLLVVLTVLLGVLYPLGIWVVSRAPGLHDPAEGSLITASSEGSRSSTLLSDGAPRSETPAGSSLIGIDPVPTNPAADPWFHTRPSASAPTDAPAGLGPANPTSSGGSNLSADSDKLRQAIVQRRGVIGAREGVDPAAVPPDAVTASGSGLDPQISPAYAALQVPRVARVTGLGEDRVRALVARAADPRPLGFLGEPGVNVPTLDALVHAAAPTAR